MAKDNLKELAEAINRLAPEDRKRLLDRLQGEGLTLAQSVAGDDGLKTVDLEEIASTYQVSTRSLLRYIKAGQLVAVRFGRKYLVTVGELKRFLAQPRPTQGMGVKHKTKHR